MSTKKYAFEYEKLKKIKENFNQSICISKDTKNRF